MFQALTGIFLALVAVVKFIKKYLLKYVGFSAILSLQFSITASTIVFVLAFYAFTITSLVAIYNKGVDIFTYVTTAPNSSVSCLFGYMNCIGITPALQNGLTMAYGVLTSVVIFHLFKFTFGAIRMVANEIFKLGVLLGQALN